MAKYRDVYLEQAKTLADAGTYTIDISPIDPISELLVNIWADNGATSNKDNPIPRIVSKIEVVDGANVLFSMDGRMTQALFYFMTKKMPDISIAEAQDYGQSANMPIRFGRWLWDPVYALAPGKFRNLQLKVTWDLEAVRAVGAAGFVTGSARLSVIAKVMEELEGEPKGYLMSKNHYSFTSSASGEERIALPTDYPYAMLMLRAYESGVNMSDTITNVKLNIDFDKTVPIDMEIGDIKNRVIDNYGLIRLPMIGKGDDTELHEAWIGELYEALATVNETGIICGINVLNNGQYSLHLRLHDNTTQTAKTSFVTIVGTAPWNCLAIPFGIGDDPATYLDAPGHGDIKAILTQGNAGAAVDLVLSQLRPY